MGKDNLSTPHKQDKIKYINDKLSNGASLHQILNSPQFEKEISRSKRALQSQFEKAGYYHNKENGEQSKHVIQLAASDCQESAPALKTGADNDNLLRILESADEIIQMSAWWKKNAHHLQTTDDKLDIPLPTGGEEVRKTIRVNTQVWEKWKSFCKKHPGYSEKDLLAKALLWFLKEV